MKTIKNFVILLVVLLSSCSTVNIENEATADYSSEIINEYEGKDENANTVNEHLTKDELLIIDTKAKIDSNKNLYLSIIIEDYNAETRQVNKKYKIYVDDILVESIEAKNLNYNLVNQGFLSEPHSIRIEIFNEFDILTHEYAQNNTMVYIPYDNSTISKLVSNNSDIETLYIIRYPYMNTCNYDSLVDLKNIKCLSIEDIELEDTTFLKHLAKLEKLYLDTWNLNNATYVGDLTDLEVLKIISYELKDISFISNNLNLKHLELFLQDDEDTLGLDGISNLIYLESIKLAYIKNLSSLDILNNNKNLIKVSLTIDDGLNSVEGIENLTKLKELDIKGNSLYNIESLSELPSLLKLSLDCHNIEDYSIINSLYNLQELSLKSDSLLDIPRVDKLVKLTVLDICSYKIRDMTEVNKLVGLKELYVECDSFEVFPELSTLKSLYIKGGNFDDLYFIEGFTSLESLKIYNSSYLKNINSLEELDLLNDIVFYECKLIEKYDALNELTQLRSLFIANCNVNSLEAIGGLKSLEKLSLIRNKLSDLTDLSKLTNLRSLALDYNYDITDITPIADISNLEKLTLRECDMISDYTPLYNLDKLNFLIVSFNDEADYNKFYEKEGLDFKIYH